MTKFKQYIRVIGHPEKLYYNDRKTKSNFFIVLKGYSGYIMPTNTELRNKIIEILDNAKTDYVVEERKATNLKRIGGLTGSPGGRRVKGVKGKRQGEDIIYTIESESERELLDKTDAVIAQLNTMGIEYEEVCKWFCMKEPIKHKVERSQGKPRFNRVLNKE